MRTKIPTIIIMLSLLFFLGCRDDAEITRLSRVLSELRTTERNLTNDNENKSNWLNQNHNNRDLKNLADTLEKENRHLSSEIDLYTRGLFFITNANTLNADNKTKSSFLTEKYGKIDFGYIKSLIKDRSKATQEHISQLKIFIIELDNRKQKLVQVADVFTDFKSEKSKLLNVNKDLYQQDGQFRRLEKEFPFCPTLMNCKERLAELKLIHNNIQRLCLERRKQVEEVKYHYQQRLTEVNLITDSDKSRAKHKWDQLEDEYNVQFTHRLDRIISHHNKWSARPFEKLITDLQ